MFLPSPDEGIQGAEKPQNTHANSLIFKELDEDDDEEDKSSNDQQYIEKTYQFEYTQHRKHRIPPFKEPAPSFLQTYGIMSTLGQSNQAKTPIDNGSQEHECYNTCAAFKDSNAVDGLAAKTSGKRGDNERQDKSGQEDGGEGMC